MTNSFNLYLLNNIKKTQRRKIVRAPHPNIGTAESETSSFKNWTIYHFFHIKTPFKFFGEYVNDVRFHIYGPSVTFWILAPRNFLFVKSLTMMIIIYILVNAIIVHVLNKVLINASFLQFVFLTRRKMLILDEVNVT